MIRFLLAKLHIEYLSTKNTVKAVREALQNLPKDLTLVYDEIMQRIDHQNDEDRQLAHSTLTWVANAKRLLSVNELREALAIETGDTSLDSDNLLDIDIILSVCAGLVIVDNARTVRLIHYTAQHYLDSIQMDRFPAAQTEITSRCLTYLSFQVFSNFPRNLSQYQLLHKHPFLAYAKYCLVHAQGQPEVVLKARIIEFLQRASQFYDFWSDFDRFVAPGPWYPRDTPLPPLCYSASSN
jgi:hypothetical protein